MNAKTFKDGLVTLKMIFPSRDINPGIYWKFLSDISDEDYTNAVNDLARNVKDVYKDTNLIALIRQNALEGYFPTAGAAYKEACSHASSIHDVYKWSHPAIKKAAYQIGMWQLQSGESVSTTRAHFIKFYEEIIRQEQKENVLSIAENSTKQLTEEGRVSP